MEETRLRHRPAAPPKKKPPKGLPFQRNFKQEGKYPLDRHPYGITMATRPKPMKPREIERLLLADGWQARPGHGKGSHRAYEHPTKPGEVVIPWHQGKEIGRGLVGRILRQAGLR